MNSVLALLKRFGSNSTSFQMLKAGFVYEYGQDSCVGYVDTGAAWIAAGDPLALPDQQEEAALQFVESAKKQGKRSAFFISHDFATHSSQIRKIAIGDEVFLNANEWAASVRTHKSFKEQLRRAKAKGVTVGQDSEGIVDPASPIRQDIERLIEDWRAAKHMDSMGFLVAIEPFTYPDERLYFIARQRGEVVGLLVAVPIYARHGWFFEHVIRSPHAPNGTAETLLNAAMVRIAERNQSYVSLGLTPLYEHVPKGFRFVRKVFRGFYDFKGLRRFKQKIPTARFEPRYLLFPASQSLFYTLKDVARAFIPQGWISFALSTIVRLPPPLWGMITLGALVWTALLANMDSARWFPSRSVHIAWVIFDLCAAYAFWHLHHGIKKKFLFFLAIVISFDAFFSIIQFLTFNRFQTYTVFQGGIVALGILAPILVDALLWANVLYSRKRQ